MDGKKETNIEVKKRNRNRVFRYICSQGTVSNPDIAYATQMSLPTVTQITKELIGQGLVEENGELQSTGGRRAKALSAAVNTKLALGLDITKNHIGMVLANLKGEILKYGRIYKPHAHEDTYYREVSGELEQFLDEDGTDRERILGMGISFPGIIDLKREMIADSHILGVKFLPFEAVTRFFAWPCLFLNDANAGAYAEGIHSGDRERFFYLSLSNTVGGAVFSAGGLEQGNSFRCGEAGHMTVMPEGETCYCGKVGCLDVYCAAKRLSDLFGGKLERFFEELDRGDQTAVRAWETYTWYLALAVNNIHMILDCDVVLGGYVGSCMGAHIQDIQSRVSERNTFQEGGAFVRPCNYKTEAAALGAALNVIEIFMEQV